MALQLDVLLRQSSANRALWKHFLFPLLSAHHSPASPPPKTFTEKKKSVQNWSYQPLLILFSAAHKSSPPPQFLLPRRQKHPETIKPKINPSQPRANAELILNQNITSTMQNLPLASSDTPGSKVLCKPLHVAICKPQACWAAPQVPKITLIETGPQRKRTPHIALL